MLSNEDLKKRIRKGRGVLLRPLSWSCISNALLFTPLSTVSVHFFPSMLLQKVVHLVFSHVGARTGFDWNIDSSSSCRFITVAIGTSVSWSEPSVYFRGNPLPLLE